MTTIKLEIPTNDPSALFHMGEALRNIAKENGYIVQDAPVLEVSDSDFKEWHERFITELATKIQIPVNTLKGNSTNASDEDRDAFINAMSGNYPKRSAAVQEVLNKPEHRDALAEQAKKNGVSICMNPETSSSVDVEDDELLSPHVTVIQHEPGVVREVEVNIAVVNTSDELIDADGLPHDKRIHSKGATRLNDNTWRMKKKPSNQTDEEWVEFVDGVKAELKQLMDIPAAGNAGISVEDITQAEINAGNLTPPTLDELAVADLEQGAIQFEGVTPNGDVAIEPSPTNVNPFEANPVVNSVLPPVVNSVTPPTSVDSEMTFPLLMKFITGNNKKLTSETVNQVLNENGIKSLPLLFSRPDLLPQIHAALVKLL